MDALILIAVILAFIIALIAIHGSSKSPVKSESRETGQGLYGHPGNAELSLEHARVEYVIDGDTLIVSRMFREIRIRLDSIDCPEDGQDWGDTAKYGLIKLVGGKRIYFEDHGPDIYGRTLATVYVGDDREDRLINVNERMVMLGHAWVMRKFYWHLPKKRRDKLNQLEKWARYKKVGLWKRSNPVPPWRWRASNK